MKLTRAYYKIDKLKKRVKVIQGGTSASKTYSILQKWIMEAGKENPKFTGVNSIVSESLPHLKRGAMRDFFEILNNEGIYNREAHNKSDSLYTINDAVFEFFSVDQEDKLRGARRKNLFINEANNITQHAYDQLEVRTQYDIWLDFNPVAEFWGHRLPDSDFVKLTYKDNGALDPNIVKAIESRQHNKQWWQVYGLGEVGTLEGVIYDNWETIDKVPEEAELIGTGLDFGFTNDPSAAVTCYRYDGEIIINEILFKKGLTNREIALMLKEKETGMIYADSAEPKSISEIRTFGVSIQGAKKGKDSVMYGIQLVRDYKLRPTKNSVNLIRALRNYSYEKDRSGNYINKPNHAFSDILDALRYLVVMRLGQNKGEYFVY